MTLLIDIIIISFIISFTLIKVFTGSAKFESLKCCSAILSLIITNFLYLNFLKIFIIGTISFLFNIAHTQIDNNFFYAVSFLIQFSIINSIILFLAQYLNKNILPHSLEDNLNIKNRVIIAFSSFLRAIIILLIFILIIDSFPSDLKRSDSKISLSKTYDSFSKLSKSLIK